jgi:hypothetical protein
LYTRVPDLQGTDKHVVADTDVAAGDRRVDDQPTARANAAISCASAGALARAVHEHAAGTEAHEDAASGIQDDLAHIVGLPMVKTTSKAVVALRPFMTVIVGLDAASRRCLDVTFAITMFWSCNNKKQAT